MVHDRTKRGTRNNKVEGVSSSRPTVKKVAMMRVSCRSSDTWRMKLPSTKAARKGKTMLQEDWVEPIVCMVMIFVCLLVLLIAPPVWLNSRMLGIEVNNTRMMEIRWKLDGCETVCRPVVPKDMGRTK